MNNVNSGSRSDSGNSVTSTGDTTVTTTVTTTIVSNEVAQPAKPEVAAKVVRSAGRPVVPDSKYQLALAHRNANPSLDNKALRTYMTETLKIPKASAQVYLSKFKKQAAASATQSVAQSAGS